MRLFRSAAALAASSLVSAQIATFAAPEDISYAVSIPGATASSGDGDWFMQLSGPSSNQWIALGVGSQMLGSLIFVMWADGNGNVTVSPRLGKGEFQPVANPQATVTLLEGSGVTNGVMTANIRCSNCSTWEGGYRVDFTSDSVSFIHAYRSGSPIDSTDPSYSITQHQVDGIPFSFDLIQATGDNITTSSNPFVQFDPSGPANNPGNVGSSPGAGADDVGGRIDRILKAHGIVMGLVIALLFPLGALMMRIFSAPWWLHAGVQFFNLCLFTAGFVLGYINAGEQAIRYTGPGKTHTTFGTVIFSLFLLQPIGGYMHHYLYKKHGSRSIVSQGHIWFGRILFILAMVNGGLGLQLAANTTGGEIAYGVIAGVVGVTYIVVATVAELRGGTLLGSKRSSGVTNHKDTNPEMSQS